MIRTPRALARATSTPTRTVLTSAGAGLAIAATGAAVATAGLAGTAAVAADGVGHAGRAGRVAHTGHVRGRSPAPRPARPESRPGRPAHGGRSGTARHPHARTWAAVGKVVAGRTSPRAGHGPLPARDRLVPAGTSGPQTWLPMNAARLANARAIVGQALAKRMGVRAAVIAVATAMQESGLENVGYGTSDSLGLFQQRPSMGWGTARQIMRPRYAADAFLNALRGYEASDPAWARQPLWQAAQGVQASGYPYAYAKWEAQAAHLVATITPRLV